MCVKVIQMTIVGMCVHRWDCADKMEHTNKVCGVYIAIPAKWATTMRQTWNLVFFGQGSKGTIGVNCENADLAFINLYSAMQKR